MLQYRVVELSAAPARAQTAPDADGPPRWGAIRGIRGAYGAATAGGPLRDAVQTKARALGGRAALAYWRSQSGDHSWRRYVDAKVVAAKLLLRRLGARAAGRSPGAFLPAP